MANKFTASPYFNLPHSNKCASSQVSEPEVTNGVPTWPNPPYTGDPSEMNGTNHTATVWYKFTMPTSGAMPDFIEWFNNDGGNGNRGTVCLTWDSEVLIYQSTSGACSFADATFVPIVEKDRPGNTCTAIIQCTGSNDQFLLSCPTAGATYYVQVGDASNSTCYEGLWTIDKIHRPAANATPPTNDEPCGAINLGTIPNGGAYNSTGVHFNNFCATANQEFRADFTQPLEKDVWFAFRPPASGSVRITAASAPSGAPASSDDDIDLQIAVWDPVLGTNSIAGHCADPRYLWAPLISQDHDIIEAGEAGNILPTYYDIYNANGDGLLSQEANEGNELIVTCLDPNKFYFIQVDGGLYGLETTPVLNLTSCDGINGDCVEGYFSLQVTDAGIYDLTHIPTTANPISADEPCFAYELPVQAAGSYDANTITYKKGSNICATATNDPIPPCWNGANNTVWYKFVAPSVGRVKIYAKELQDNNFEPRIPGGVASDHDYHDDMNLQLAVYDQVSGSCLNKAGLSLITCDYDGATLESTPSIVGVQNDDYVAFPTDGFDEYTLVKCLIPGHTYYVMVDGENDPNLGLGANTEDVVGNFQIAIEAVGTIPASTNDDVCDAYDMVGTQSHVAGSSALRFPATGHFNNECATIETFEQSGGIADDIDDDDNIPVFSLTNIVEHTLWFKFKAPASGKVEIRAINAGTGDDIDLAMAIYDFPSATCATASAGLTITEEYDGPASDEDLDAECLIPGRYYYLQVDGDANSACDLILPSNCETGDFYLEFEALPVQPRADIAPQLNDDICDAKNLGTLVNGTNITRNNDNNRCATQELDEPATGGTNLSVFADQDRTVWYRFTTSANPGPLYIRANDPVSATTLDLDIDLYEYDGTYIYAPCITSNVFNNLIRVGEGDILICGLTPNCEDLTLNCPKPSTTYFLQVTGSASVLGLGFGGDQGTFDILVSPSATPNATLANDNICSSTVLGSLASGATLSRTNQNNFCATQELDEPNTDQGCLADQDCAEETVWYSFTTGATPGVISVLVDGINTGVSDFYPYVTLYRAPSTSYNACTSDFTGIVDVAADGLIINPITHDASVDIPCPTPNTKYYIQVDGLDGVAGIPNDEGTFNLSVIDDGSGSARPVNDNLVNTINLGTLAAGAAIATTGHNFCASAETNEPNTQYGGNETTNHDNSNEDETVWYKFKTSLAPGLITINVNDDAAFPEAFTSGFTLYYNNGTAPNYRITGAPSSTLIQEGSSNTGILGTSEVHICVCCQIQNIIYK
jgi:hypothetical protein